MRTTPTGLKRHRRGRPLAQPQPALGRWLRVAQQAAEYTRQAGWRAAVHRAALALRGLLPVAARAARRRLAPRSSRYRAWQRRTEPGPAALAEQHAAQASLPYRPLFSLLVPASAFPPAALQALLASAGAQTYGQWEVCLAGAVAPEAGAGETRVRRLPLPAGQGAHAELCAALAMARGDFVLLLEDAGELAPDLLFALARRLSADPTLDILYFDEDQLASRGGARRAPWFKPPRWSPALMLSANLLRCAALRRSLVLDAGGLEPCHAGALSWDLALHLVERTQRLAHVAAVGFHAWATVPARTEAVRECLDAHLARTGHPAARAGMSASGALRVRWPAPAGLASIVIVTRDQLPLLQACLESIFALTTGAAYEVVLVDTSSELAETWAYYDALARAGRPVRVVSFAGEFNYSAANNLGASEARGEYLVFLNNDTECLDADWLTELLGWAAQPEVGLVGAKLQRPNGTLQHAGVIIGLAGHGSHAFDGGREGDSGPHGSTEWYRDVLAVTGSCAALRRAVFERAGGFDTAYQVGYSDLELGLRINALGWRVVYTPFACLLHHEGATRGLDQPPADVLRAYWQMLPIVSAGDPYFSPHLSSVERRPALAAPDEASRVELLEQVLSEYDLLYRPVPGTPLGWGGADARAERFAPAGANAPAAGPRVLVVAHDLGLTGAPHMLTQAALVLAQAGYEVRAVAPADGPQRARLTNAGVEVCLEPAVLEDARVFAPHLEGRVLVLANTILTWRAVLAARAASVPCLWWIHESAFGEAQVRRVMGLAQALRVADLLLFASQATAERYAGLAPTHRTAVLRNGVADVAAQQIGGPPGALDETQLVVSLGSLEPRKGQDVLLRAVAALPAPLRERTRTVLIGQALHGGYWRRLQRLAARAGGRVALLGARPHAEALDHMRAAAVFALSSRDEALPVALLEAMALGKAIVATRAGGITEVLRDDVEALLVPPGEAGALATALARLLADAALRERLGRAARARFEAEFTLERFAAGLLEKVAALIAAPAAHAPGGLGARERPGEPLTVYLPNATRNGRPLLRMAPLAGVQAGPADDIW